MSFLPNNSLTSFVPTDVILPDDPTELRRSLDDILRKIIDALNDKQIGHYNTVEGVNGDKFFTPGDPQNFKGVYRKVIDFGALPNSATKSIAHGITISSTTEFTHIYATATDPSTSFIPIPYVDMSGGNNHIQLSLDSTNVTIITNFNYSGYTTCYVVVEYTQG